MFSMAHRHTRSVVYAAAFVSLIGLSQAQPLPGGGFVSFLRDAFAAFLPGSTEKRGSSLDPNGSTTDSGSKLDPNGATGDSGSGLDPNGRT
jgi:hypothetical protein